jgi:hypothetical protein
MTIADASNAGKALLARVPLGAWVLLVVVLASSASFGLGILAGRDMGQGRGISIGEVPMTAPGPTGLPAAVLEAAGASGAISQAPAPAAPADIPASAPAAIPAGGQYVASKSGTKYYLPWCGTVSRIKDENKVWFASKADAEAAGYAPAANCQGL